MFQILVFRLLILFRTMLLASLAIRAMFKYLIFTSILWPVRKAFTFLMLITFSFLTDMLLLIAPYNRILTAITLLLIISRLMPLEFLVSNLEVVIIMLR